MTRYTTLDDATMRALERHETQAHAIPSREMRDLGDAYVLYDPRDPDPFWNRMASVRWPGGRAAFDARLAEGLALFGVLGRVPHIWPSPLHSAPPDLADRLRAAGFRDAGAGHVMVLSDPGAAVAIARPAASEHGVTVRTIHSARDAGSDDLADVGVVLAESFGAPPGRAAELAADLRLTLDDDRVLLVLARVDGEPAAVAKATTFDGFTYLSSIGTREAYRGRGLARLTTRTAVAAAAQSSRLAYLGVWTENEPALRVYADLGFASLGVSPDLLLE
ncbi:MAG TPA: GNAT family N-acetyltransferase [Candidatus Limnocylindrales bacterium]|nr:GNAT family N-acetyltransferase [Candidatus Limnocylindrales bacterium]